MHVSVIPVWCAQYENAITVIPKRTNGMSTERALSRHAGDDAPTCSHPSHPIREERRTMYLHATGAPGTTGKSRVSVA